MDDRWDSLWTNARLATMTAGGAAYGAIEQGAIAVKDGRIAWAGAMAELRGVSAGEVHDAGGRWITPGLIDCHSHIVYGGGRAAEFELRLEGAGYEVIDLGVNKTPDEILERANELDPNVVGLSALLTTSMPSMKKTVDLFKRVGSKYPVIIGGAPVTREFADVIKADGYGENAPHAVETVHALVAAQTARVA